MLVFHEQILSLLDEKKVTHGVSRVFDASYVLCIQCMACVWEKRCLIVTDSARFHTCLLLQLWLGRMQKHTEYTHRVFCQLFEKYNAKKKWQHFWKEGEREKKEQFKLSANTRQVLETKRRSLSILSFLGETSPSSRLTTCAQRLLLPAIFFFVSLHSHSQTKQRDAKCRGCIHYYRMVARDWLFHPPVNA